MTDNSSSTSIKDSENLEQKLESILSQIQGVGEVQVFINYSESSETVAMYNENTKTSTTEETDTSGGTRKVESTDSQKELVYQEENGEKAPIIQKTVQPKIEGAIITAKGASNATVKTNMERTSLERVAVGRIADCFRGVVVYCRLDVCNSAYLLRTAGI